MPFGAPFSGWSPGGVTESLYIIVSLGTENLQELAVGGVCVAEKGKVY